jgi:hypothetical protein
MICKVVVLGQERDRNNAVANQQPNSGRHDCSHLIAMIHPNSILLVGSKGAFRWIVIE